MINERKSLWRLAAGYLRRPLTIAGGSYLGVLALLMLLENSLVYHPTKEKQDWEPAPAPDVQDVRLKAADGTDIHAWWWPTPQARGAILYCHGNGGNLSHRGPILDGLRKLLGASVLIFDYPGYGKSGGRPSEAGCYAAADAAYDWLVRQGVPPSEIIIYGGSLGGGIAVDLASRREHRALVLVKTFTSAPDVGKSMYPWLPIRWLMRNRFDSLGKIGNCRKPVFVAHGTADSLIPFKLGKQLFEAANEPKMFFQIDGGDHNSPLPAACFTQLRDFLAKH